MERIIDNRITGISKKQCKYIFICVQHLANISIYIYFRILISIIHVHHIWYIWKHRYTSRCLFKIVNISKYLNEKQSNKKVQTQETFASRRFVSNYRRSFLNLSFVQSGREGCNPEQMFLFHLTTPPPFSPIKSGQFFLSQKMSYFFCFV